MSPPDPIDYLPVRQPSSSKTYDFVEELYPQLAWQTSLPQPPLGDNPLTPGPRVRDHDLSHGLPGRPSPRAPIPRQEVYKPPAGDRCSSGRTPSSGDRFWANVLYSALSTMSSPVPHRSAVDAAPPESFRPPLLSCRGGYYPNSRLQPMGLAFSRASVWGLLPRFFWPVDRRPCGPAG